MWLAVSLATALMFFSYTLFMFGLAAASEDETAFSGGLIGIALGLVPGVFLAAAGLSRHERAIRASFLATLLWLTITLPVAIFDVPTGLVAGFGAGGIVALHHPGNHTALLRVGAVAVCVAYTFLVQRIVPAAGIMVGAITPFAAIALADALQENEANTQPRSR